MAGDELVLYPNEEEVAVEVLQGEAVLINLRTGHYYSMDKAAADVWQMIERRQGLGTIAAALARRYDVAAERAHADVAGLFDELQRERLALDATAAGETSGGALPPLETRLPYEPPRLNRYSDMADMLALDPPLPGLKDIPWKA
jgi:hypothetical protein